MIDIKLGIARFMYERGDGATLYIGKQHKSVYVSFHNGLQRGWKSYPHYSWNKHGWYYYQSAILLGSQRSYNSKWLYLPEVLIPSKLYDLWLMRHRSYREVPMPSQEIKNK